MKDRSILNIRFKFFERNRLPIFSFLFTAIILEISYITIGVFPFGPKDVLIIDLYHQYAPFLSELQDRLASYSSLIYSWSGGLGLDFFSTIAYYLASPMNILLLIFPKSWLTEAVLVLILIKTGLSAAFFTVFLQKAYGKNNLSVAAFSMMYALSGYALAYSWDIMWLEGIYLMPLIFLGLIRLIKHESALLYTITLGLLLFSNFYISFFVVLFIIIYYPVLLIQFLPEKNVHSIVKKTFQVLMFSLLGVGLSAIMILPTLAALKLTSAAGSHFPSRITEYFNLIDYIERHYPITAPAIREGLPNIYCGFAALVLAPVFFLSKRFTKADKIAHAILLLVFILSFNLDVLNFIWHGFHFPNQLPYRNALVYIFFFVVMSFRALDARNEFSEKQWVSICGAFALLLLIIQKLNGMKPGFPEIYVILILIGIIALAFSVKHDERVNNSRFIRCLTLAISIELLTSTIFMINKMNMTEYYSIRDGYLAGGKPAALMEEIKKIEEKETGFYRMEILQPKTPNDPYLYNYNGLSIFSSMMPTKIVRTMENLGYHSNSINSYKYESSTLLLDSLFGIKYIADQKSQLTDNLKNVINKKDELTIYENPYAVSIAYMADPKIKQWYSTSNSPYNTHHRLIDCLTGINEVYNTVEVEAGTGYNASVKKTGYYNFSFTRNNQKSESRISLIIQTGKADRNLNFYLDTRPNVIDYGYIMVGSTRIDFNAKRSTLVDLGTIAAGTSVTVELVYSADSETSGGFSFYACELNVDRFKEAMQIVRDNSMKVDKFEDGYVKGSIDVKEKGVLFTTIPYHTGWTVWVDGSKASYYAIDDAFLALDLDEGRHTVEMRYMTPYLKPGAVITFASILIILAGVLFNIRYFRNKPVQNKSVSENNTDLLENDNS